MKTFKETKAKTVIGGITNLPTPDNLPCQCDFKQLLQNIPAAYYVCDNRGYITFFNIEAARLWGKEPVIGQDLWSGFWKISDLNGNKIPLDKCPMAVCIREQKPVTGETMVVERPDGIRRIIKPHPQPIFNANGDFVGASDMLFDITDFAKSKKELSDIKSEVEEILDSISDGYCSIDKKWVVRAWNKTAEIQTGIKRVDIVGTDYKNTLRNYLPENCIIQFDTAMKQKKSVKFEQNYPEVGVWLEFLGYPSKIGMNLYVKDINEKKEHFIEILAAKNNTSSLINASKDFLWSVNSKFELIAGNDAYKDAVEQVTGVRLREGDNVLLPQFGGSNLRWENYYKSSLEGAGFCVDYESIIGTSKKLNSEEVCFNPIYDLEKNKVIGVACSSRNITERKEQEKLIKQNNAILKEKEERLQKLARDLKKVMDSSLDVICSFDIEGKFINVSAASAKVWGYSPEELVGRNYLDFVPDEYKEITTKAVLEIMSGVEMTNFENTYIRKDGYHTPLLWSIKWDEKENAMFCVAKDATQIKNAERLKSATEERFSTIMQKGADLIGIIDVNGEYKYVSSNIDRVLGYSVDDITGKNALSFIHEEDIEKAIEGLAALMNTTEVKMADLRFKNGFGEWRWVEVIVTNMLDNEIINGIVINSRDITDRKLHEEELRTSNERFEIVSKATNEAIWDYNVLKDDLCWNNNYTKLFGYKKSEYSLDRWKDNIHPDDVEEVWNSFQKLIHENKNRYWKAEYRYKKANGDYACIFDQGYLLTNKNNKLVRIVGAMQDNTERKKIEQEKEVIIKELTTSNNDLKQFSFITSHNLRAPLSNIIGILDVIDDADFSDSNNQMFGLLKASAVKLQETIKDLNDIIVIRNRAIENQDINIETVFKNVEKNFLNTLNEIPHQLNLDFKVKEGSLNKSYIESIFINLLSNAIKYRSVDRPLKIEVSTCKNEMGSCLIKFSDNGTGLDASKLKNRLFGLYQRFHHNIEGKGLGLFMVKSQVTALGGTIMIESAVNTGTTFTINLPLKNTF